MIADKEDITLIEPHCPDCGAPGVASPDACKELFTEVGARVFLRLPCCTGAR